MRTCKGASSSSSTGGHGSTRGVAGPSTSESNGTIEEISPYEEHLRASSSGSHSRGATAKGASDASSASAPNSILGGSASFPPSPIAELLHHEDITSQDSDAVNSLRPDPNWGPNPLASWRPAKRRHTLDSGGTFSSSAMSSASTSTVAPRENNSDMNPPSTSTTTVGNGNNQQHRRPMPIAQRIYIRDIPFLMPGLAVPPHMGMSVAGQPLTTPSPSSHSSSSAPSPYAASSYSAASRAASSPSDPSQPSSSSMSSGGLSISSASSSGRSQLLLQQQQLSSQLSMSSNSGSSPAGVGPHHMHGQSQGLPQIQAQGQAQPLQYQSQLQAHTRHFNQSHPSWSSEGSTQSSQFSSAPTPIATSTQSSMNISTNSLASSDGVFQAPLPPSPSHSRSNSQSNSHSPQRRMSITMPGSTHPYQLAQRFRMQQQRLGRQYSDTSLSVSTLSDSGTNTGDWTPASSTPGDQYFSMLPHGDNFTEFRNFQQQQQQQANAHSPASIYPSQVAPDPNSVTGSGSDQHLNQHHFQHELLHSRPQHSHSNSNPTNNSLQHVTAGGHEHALGQKQGYPQRVEQSHGGGNSNGGGVDSGSGSGSGSTGGGGNPSPATGSYQSSPTTATATYLSPADPPPPSSGWHHPSGPTQADAHFLHAQAQAQLQAHAQAQAQAQVQAQPLAQSPFFYHPGISPLASPSMTVIGSGPGTVPMGIGLDGVDGNHSRTSTSQGRTQQMVDSSRSISMPNMGPGAQYHQHPHQQQQQQPQPQQHETQQQHEQQYQQQRQDLVWHPPAPSSFATPGTPQHELEMIIGYGYDYGSGPPLLPSPGHHMMVGADGAAEAQAANSWNAHVDAG